MHIQKRTWPLILAVSFLAFWASSCCPGLQESLTVSLRPQETEMWCWAASGQMVMDYHGKNVNQCTQANDYLQRTDCCNSPAPYICIQGGWPQFGKYAFQFLKTSSTALNWTDLKKEISKGQQCGGRPFCFTWKWDGDGGHMMVAVGYKSIGDLRWVEVLDPLPVQEGTHKFISYEAYVNGPGYSHWDDYYEVIPQGGR